jgi:hypothetical protein
MIELFFFVSRLKGHFYEMLCRPAVRSRGQPQNPENQWNPFYIEKKIVAFKWEILKFNKRSANLTLDQNYIPYHNLTHFFVGLSFEIKVKQILY